jgi:hypothetical protein
VTRRRGVTDDEVRRDEANDESNYEAAKEGGCCCLYEALVAFCGVAAISLVMVSLPAR